MKPFIGIVNIFFLVVGVAIRRDYDISIPGGLIEVDNRILLEESFPVEGQISTVFIYSLEEHTLLTRYIADGAVGVDIRPRPVSVINLPASELNERGRIQYEASINASIIQAFEAANVDITYEFNGVRVIFRAESVALPIGTLITSVDGTPIQSLDEFMRVIEDRSSITVNDAIELTRNEDGLFGITIAEEYTIIDSAIGYEIVSANIQGGSGGLLQTLNLYNRLTEEDITKGYHIAGTGTITAGGFVGPIGGAAQKVIAAARDGVDIFFVPVYDYPEARAELDRLDTSMKLVMVASFSEALAYLSELS
jgi:Lon-like protease